MSDDISELVRELRAMPCAADCGCDIELGGRCTQLKAADALERLHEERDGWRSGVEIEATRGDMLQSERDDWRARAEKAEAELAEYQTCLGPNWNPNHD